MNLEARTRDHTCSGQDEIAVEQYDGDSYDNPRILREGPRHPHGGQTDRRQNNQTQDDDTRIKQETACRTLTPLRRTRLRTRPAVRSGSGFLSFFTFAHKEHPPQKMISALLYRGEREKRNGKLRRRRDKDPGPSGYERLNLQKIIK